MLSCLIWSVLLSFGAADVIWVPDDHASIQEAIDAASNGDTVRVRDGHYVEIINFNGKTITVESENGPESTTIDAGGSKFGSHNCCDASPFNGGCTSEACAAEVCYYEPTCCTEVWQQFCADLAEDLCGCGGAVVTFNTAEGNNSILRGFTIRGGTGSTEVFWNKGGGIYCGGASPTIEGNIITDNHVTTDGGGLYFTQSSAVLIGNTISNNSADWYNGGGIYAVASSLVMQNNTITGNYSISGSGGAMRLEECIDISMIGNTIENNQAMGDDGGGVYVTCNNFQFTGNIVRGNSGNDVGGGLYIGCQVASITNNIIEGNTTRDDGGGFWLNAVDATVSFNTITGNYAGGPNYDTPGDIGGGMDCTITGTGIIKANTISGNRAWNDGGGARLVGGDLLLDGNIFDDNSTQGNGGGLYCSQTSRLVIKGCRFRGNVSGDLGYGGQGGGLRVVAAEDTWIVGNTIQDNISHDKGGGLYTGGGVVAGNLMTGNRARWHGGGAYASGSTLMVNNTIMDNVAGDSGGGAHAQEGVTHNSIIRGNKAQKGAQYWTNNHAAVVTHSNIEGGYDGAGNIDLEPAFADDPRHFPTITGDYRMTACSSGVNLGDDGVVPADEADLDGDGDVTEPMPLDLAGAIRFVGVVDMGCHEQMVVGPACPAAEDCDGNGIRDELDLLDCDGSDWCLDCNGNGRLDACDLVSAADSATTVQGYWRFEEAGEEVLDDGPYGLVGEPKEAEYSGEVGPATILETGAPNTGALYLGGVGRVLIDDDFNVTTFTANDPQAFTFECWVRVDELGGKQVLVHRKDHPHPDYYTNYTIYAQGGGIHQNVDVNFGKTSGINGRELVMFFGGNGNIWTVTSNLLIQDNQWHHVSVAHDAWSHSIRFGLDSDFETLTYNKNMAHHPAFMDLMLGGKRNAQGSINQRLKGAIDEVRICTGILAPSQLLNTLPAGTTADCNGNGLPDDCDLASGTSEDADGDGWPDECDACLGDLDGDGVVGVDDLLEMIAQWGGDGSGDLDDNSVVDVNDVLLLLNEWGNC
ncbi:MAG: hypothetical protein MK116_10110 [Phycisphaerales bacterium]|nr:hypothetical protein [Phycisphaerales bacterium]